MRKRERFVVGGVRKSTLYGISSSFNPLYLVLIPMVRGRGPETEETGYVRDRHCDVVDPKALVV